MNNLQNQGTANLSLMPGAEATGGWPALAQLFAGLAGDVVLVLDEGGRILCAAAGGVAPGDGGPHAWEGKAWHDIVAPDSRPKVAAMLQELAAQGQARRREINCLADDGHALPLSCSGLRLGEHGPSLVVGRDLGAIAAVQQQLVQTQQQLEAAYWEARQRLGKGPGG